MCFCLLPHFHCLEMVHPLKYLCLKHNMLFMPSPSLQWLQHQFHICHIFLMASIFFQPLSQCAFGPTGWSMLHQLPAALHGRVQLARLRLSNKGRKWTLAHIHELTMKIQSDFWHSSYSSIAWWELYRFNPHRQPIFIRSLLKCPSARHGPIFTQSSHIALESALNV